MADDRSPAERQADEERDAYRKIDQAQKVSQLLDSKAFKDATEAIMDQLLYRDLPNCAADDDRGRYRVQVGVEMLNLIIKNLRHHIDTGKLAQSSLAHMEREKKRRSAA